MVGSDLVEERRLDQTGCQVDCEELVGGQKKRKRKSGKTHDMHKEVWNVRYMTSIVLPSVSLLSRRRALLDTVVVQIKSGGGRW